MDIREDVATGSRMSIDVCNMESLDEHHTIYKKF